MVKKQQTYQDPAEQVRLAAALRVAERLAREALDRQRKAEPEVREDVAAIAWQLGIAASVVEAEVVSLTPVEEMTGRLYDTATGVVAS